MALCKKYHRQFMWPNIDLLCFTSVSWFWMFKHYMHGVCGFWTMVCLYYMDMSAMPIGKEPLGLMVQHECVIQSWHPGCLHTFSGSSHTCPSFWRNNIIVCWDGMLWVFIPCNYETGSGPFCVLLDPDPAAVVQDLLIRTIFLLLFLSLNIFEDFFKSCNTQI